jgi:uncharacterized membrane protein
MAMTQYTDAVTRYAPPAPDFVREGAPSVSDIERLIAVVGGGALAYFGWQRRSEPLGMALLALGGALVAHGATGYPEVPHERIAPERLRQLASERLRARPVTVSRGVTINRPRAEVYRFWRNFDNLPRFMEHLQRVDVLSSRRSHWVVRGPMGWSVEWDAEVEEERPNEWIAWRSVPGADVNNSGLVTFRDGPLGRGTEIHATITYEPPLGALGQAVARMFGEEPGQQLRDDLERLKELLEAGEAV